MPTDTPTVYIDRAEFDARCRKYHLTPEPVYAEGVIEAHYRSICYRAPLTTEETDHD